MCWCEKIVLVGIRLSNNTTRIVIWGYNVYVCMLLCKIYGLCMYIVQEKNVMLVIENENRMKENEVKRIFLSSYM